MQLSINKESRCISGSAYYLNSAPLKKTVPIEYLTVESRIRPDIDILPAWASPREQKPFFSTRPCALHVFVHVRPMKRRRVKERWLPWRKKMQREDWVFLRGESRTGNSSRSIRKQSWDYCKEEQRCYRCWPRISDLENNIGI